MGSIHQLTPWWSDRIARCWFLLGTHLLGRWIQLDTTESTATLRMFLRVPHLGYPQVRIEFSTISGPRVYGPPGPSPHRFPDGSLCLWYPRDPPENRWAEEDGLLALLEMTSLHLLREDEWRRSGRWPGPEAPHEPIGKGPRP